MYDLVNHQFGYWKVIRREYKNDKLGWLCRCECGTERVLLTYKLTSGRSKSCGCRQSLKEGSNANPFNYNMYLTIKYAVLDRDEKAEFVRNHLNIPLFLAEHLVKDWTENE